MATSNALGEFLRARRAAVTPKQAGLPVRAGEQRRVAGLRREEVALLAGVSHDYYARLEQVRERAPSAQVVAALSAALCLTDDAGAHLHRLAGTTPTGPVAVSERVDPALIQLMSAWPDNPALIYNPAYDVLAANAIADELFGRWSHSHNLLQIVFTDPARAPSTATGRRLPPTRSPGFGWPTGSTPRIPGCVTSSRPC